MKILHLSKFENLGGAARAANRIHRCLLGELDSTMMVGSKQTDDNTVKRHGGRVEEFKYQLKSAAAQRVLKYFSLQTELQSLSCFSSSLPNAINRHPADIVHLHWVQGEFLSLADVSKIKKPIVWTLHDMWPLGGTAHYFPLNGSGADAGKEKSAWLPQKRLVRKTKLWRDNTITFLANSAWMYKQALASPVTAHHDVKLLHYPLDTNVWKPVNKTFARNLLSIGAGKRVILFGAIGGGSDPRKGFAELTKALSELSISGDLNNTILLIFGAQSIELGATITCEIKCLGHIHDDITMSLIYSAADVMVVPSLQEAFGQTASESLACCTPVVCFDVGGLKDTVVHLKSGYRALLGDTQDLARGIKFILDHQEPDRLANYGRYDMELKYSHDSMLKKYKEMYQDVLNRTKP